MQRKTKQSAFTLIELLVVIAIIGILATLAIVALQQARQNARDAKRVADVKQMSTALELFFNDNQSYPDALEELQTGGYMQILPSAPSVADGGCLPEDSNYSYSVSANKDFYQLRFCTGKQVSDLTPGNVCMTPGGLTTNCSAAALAPDPNPLCDPLEAVTFVDDDSDGYLDVHTCCELSAIRNNPTLNYELVNNLNCSNSENWVQDISGDTYNGFVTIMGFSGDLKGNNNTIDGLYFTYNTGSYITTGQWAGLLEIPSGANVSVSNLNINNSKIVRSTGGMAAFISPSVRGSLSISGSSLTNSLVQHSGGDSVAGFVGIVDGGSLSIDNSYVSGLDVSYSLGNGFGGMVAIFTTASSNNTISNSRVINSEIIGSRCGGLGGMVQMAHNLTIENSYVDNVNFDNGSCSGAGGIAYDASYTDITDSYVTNSNFLVPGSGSNGAGTGYAGFFPSSSNGNVNISNSYTDNLSIRPKSAGCGSGMVCSLGANSSITNSYVSNLDLFNDVGNGGMAGMVGVSSDALNSISNSYVIDSVIVNACSNVAGLIGDITNGEIINSHVINTEISSLGCGTAGFANNVGSATISSSSFKNGSVSSTVGNGTTGGFLNFSSNSTISDSFFEGNVSGSFPSPTGNALSGFFSSNGISSSVITNSYVSGEIVGDAEYKSCFSNSTISVSGSYYNNTRCTAGDSSGASGLSDANMKNSASYTGWNINTPSCSGADDTNPWRWTAGNYPCLYSDSTCSCS
ncbi:MAG: type II secretion system protein [Patescibacteria group bacterium]